MSTTLKKSSISYTQRDFDSIKAGLLNFTKRYYPEIINDFNEASFNAFVIDIVSYVGDVLSFYIDYQANESMLLTATEIGNIVKHGRSVSYPFKGRRASSGQVAVFVEVDADSNGGVDTTYIPILKKGTTINGGTAGVFTLNENIDFRKANITSIVSQVNSSTGIPTKYALKGFGHVVSGKNVSRQFSVGSFQKFLRLEVPEGVLVTSILSVFDESGNEYYEVENLTQNLVYTQVPNLGDDKTTVTYKLSRMAVPRRFEVEYEAGKTFLRFGAGSGTKIKDDVVNEPRNVVLDQDGRDYISSTTFDPTKLVDTDKFGVAPYDTTLTVTYRINTSVATNASAGQLTSFSTILTDFPNDGAVSDTIKSVVIGSLESVNEEPILGDVSGETKEELKRRILAHSAAQNRAITKEDYISAVYKMDSRFGAVKRCNIIKDFDSDRRNLNLYIVAQDENGFLTAPTSTLKQNLKNWLLRYKPINDTVDILGGVIVNFGIEYSIIVDDRFDKFDVLTQANTALADKFANVKDFGESMFISDVYKELIVKVDGLLDVSQVNIVNKVGGLYSSVFYDTVSNLSADSRYLRVPEDHILELKYPEQDIKGTVL